LQGLEEFMQCKYCKGKDFDNLSYNYYVCRDCGKINYVDKQEDKKSGPLGEIYFAIAAGTVVIIITILILLFVTAASKRDKAQSAPAGASLSSEK
jgi:hypothetical protein